MQVRTFDFNNNKITTLTDKDLKVWFVASEVCKKLGYKNTSQAVSDHCIKKGISFGYSLTDGGKQKSLLIDEPNLYRLIMRSKENNAILFQDWVCEEVLPSIRKTGKYDITESFKSKSTADRNILTEAWKECGIEKRHHYIQLTLQEYKALGIEDGKRKKDLTRGELLALNALESMEALKLFHDKKDGYYECRDSIKDTAKHLPISKIKEIA